MSDIFRKIKQRLNKGVIRIQPRTPAKGRVLLSYTTLPFISPWSISGHSNRWECKEMASLWAKKGFMVDVVDFNNEQFVPKQSYNYCIDISHHLEKFAPLLGESCIKIFHIPAAHWKFQNNAEEGRIRDIEKKKGVTLKVRRTAIPSSNIEIADVATTLGGTFSASTYDFAGKKLIRIPVASSWTRPFPGQKDFAAARSSFIWMGGAGMAHKGLDLVLEAFVRMPDLNLTVFGKKDDDFATVYHKELFETPNIRYAGLANLASIEFQATVDRSIATVFPSCSEGASTSVIDLMHSALIPIVSHEASVDTLDFGIELSDNTTESIVAAVRMISTMHPKELKTRARKAWEYANQNHTCENFSKKYSAFIDDLLSHRV